MLAGVLFGLLAANPGDGALPLWVTFDIINPESVGGHRILHLEDVIGPEHRRDVPGLPSPTAVLLFSVGPADCVSDGLCAEVAAWSAGARKEGALVVAVVLTERERADAARTRLASAEHPLTIAVDPHGAVSALAGLQTPGTFIVVDSAGRSRRWAPEPGKAQVSSRALEQIRAALGAAARPRGG